MGAINPTTAGLITGGVGTALNIFDTLFNANQTEIANRRSQNFQWEMYNRQRQDAIADRDFSNNYNSPAAQMERLKAAGLNPNLVYGNGAAQSQSVVTRAASPGSFTARPATSDSSGAVSAVAKGLEMMYSLANTQAQTNNLQANHDVIVAEAALKHAQTENVGAQTETEHYKQSEIDAERRLKEYDLRQRTRLSDIAVTEAELRNRKLLADTQFTLDQNQRAAALQSMSLREAASRILSMEMERAKSVQEQSRIRQEIQNLQTDQKLKEQDLYLKQNGIQPHDNLFMRLLQEALNPILGKDARNPANR